MLDLFGERRGAAVELSEWGRGVETVLLSSWDRSLGPRDGRGDPREGKGCKYFRRRFTLGVFFSCPLFRVSSCMEGASSGMDYYLPPGDVFL